MPARLGPATPKRRLESLPVLGEYHPGATGVGGSRGPLDRNRHPGRSLRVLRRGRLDAPPGPGENHLGRGFLRASRQRDGQSSLGEAAVPPCSRSWGEAAVFDSPAGGRIGLGRARGASLVHPRGGWSGLGARRPLRRGPRGWHLPSGAGRGGARCGGRRSDPPSPCRSPAQLPDLPADRARAASRRHPASVGGIAGSEPWREPDSLDRLGSGRGGPCDAADRLGDR